MTRTLACLFVLLPTILHAATTVTLKRPAAIYATPQQVIGKLDTGAQVEITQPGQIWTRVRYRTSLAEFSGFIKTDILKAGRVRTDATPTKPTASVAPGISDYPIKGQIIAPKLRTNPRRLKKRKERIFSYEYHLQTDLKRIQEPYVQAYLLAEMPNTERRILEVDFLRFRQAAGNADISTAAIEKTKVHSAAIRIHETYRLLSWRIELRHGGTPDGKTKSVLLDAFQIILPEGKRKHVEENWLSKHNKEYSTWSLTAVRK